MVNAAVSTATSMGSNTSLSKYSLRPPVRPPGPLIVNEHTVYLAEEVNGGLNILLLSGTHFVSKFRPR